MTTPRSPRSPAARQAMAKTDRAAPLGPAADAGAPNADTEGDGEACLVPAAERVCRMLTAVLENEPAIEDTLVITDALDLLLDVDPPFPPLCSDDAPVGEVGVPAALAMLDEAAADATSVRELTRYTAVALLLQQVPIARVDR